MTNPTPSQTVGPFFHIGLSEGERTDLVSPNDPDAIRVEGVILDGEGRPVSDAMVEIWQANAAGRYRHDEDTRSELPLAEGFDGFGRCATEGNGHFRFVTVKPGKVPAAGGEMQAPHIEISVFARGLLKHLVTRIYFADEEEANLQDPVLSAIEEPDRRSTLLAAQQDGGYRFDIHLQGERETVFFDV
jgi:protocatechuate 3,4-dioxygenase, alpha subunit